MPHAVINNARLWYDTPGSPPQGAEPLLLHHGYTASRFNWLPVAEQLQDRFRIILMECRGAGDSEDTADGYTLSQMARDVIGMADHLGLDTFTYAGHSMGGGIGFLLGLDHAERLQRLILMAPIPSGGTGESSPAYVNGRLTARAAGDRAYLQAEQRRYQFRPEVQTDAWFNQRVDDLLRVSDGHLLGGLETMQALDVTERLATLSTPTLMLAGGVDGLLKANLEDYLRLPNASLQVFARAGHEVAVHEPEGVSHAIRDFMLHGPVTAASLMRAQEET